MRILLLAALFSFPVNAAETQETQKQDVYCDGQWCAIKQETLKELIDGTKTLSEYVRRIESLCKWQK